MSPRLFPTLALAAAQCHPPLGGLYVDYEEVLQLIASLAASSEHSQPSSHTTPSTSRRPLLWLQAHQGPEWGRRREDLPHRSVDTVKEEMRDVLERAYGEEGARKRANLLSVQEKLQAAWAEDGIAKREVEAFLDQL